MQHDYHIATQAKFDALNELIEQHEAEIVRLLDSREREGDRLDWLLSRVGGSELRRLVGEMNSTSDVREWREKLDAAMGYKTI
jgi:hypothetical protein